MHGAIPIGFVYLEGGCGAGDAGIVYQNSDSTDGALSCHKAVVDAVGICHIHNHWHGFGAVRFYFLRELF